MRAVISAARKTNGLADSEDMPFIERFVECAATMS